MTNLSFPALELGFSPDKSCVVQNTELGVTTQRFPRQILHSEGQFEILRL